MRQNIVVIIKCLLSGLQNHRNRSNVIILFAPGWARQNQKAEEKFCLKLLENVVDAGLLTIPFHQARTPKECIYSGEYFISGNIFWTSMNFRHFVAEIRLLIRYMRNYYDYVGIIGQSSGGFQSGCAITSEEVDFHFPFITGAQLGSIVWSGIITKYVRKDVINIRKYTEQELNLAWALGDQEYIGHHCKAKYIKHYISKYDMTVKPQFQNRLWEIYGKKSHGLKLWT